MRKFVTLAGVIIACWLSSEKPSHAYAYNYCPYMNGSYCDSGVIHPDDASLCYTSDPFIDGFCNCINYSWHCVY